MKESLKNLSEKTLVPLSVAVAVATGAMWLRTVELMGLANAKSISALEQEQQRDSEARVQILIQLERMNAKLEALADQPSKRKPARD